MTSTSHEIPTDDLVERAKAGDVSAFEMLYRQHSRAIYSLCYRMVANHAKAEELTQEVFVRLWQKLELFHGQSAFSTWFYRLATNVVLSAMRRKKFIESRQDYDDLLNQHSEPISHPGQGLDLENAILSLPKGARHVFVLHDVEGHKHAEIAEMLCIATGTSKTQLHRARKLLQEWMK
jgi:RNA polymerase sigma-70 factor (ECF subfamily)